jgi:hypothetical protein
VSAIDGYLPIHAIPITWALYGEDERHVCIDNDTRGRQKTKDQTSQVPNKVAAVSLRQVGGAAALLETTGGGLANCPQ